MPSILISGAGIGGPVLAWWLARAGWTCTIVERDATPRLTGQQIDIRGAGTTIVEQMGMLDAIKAACVQEKGWGFVDDSGRRRAGFAVGEGTADGFTAEIEILRGELASVLMKSVDDNPNVRIVYGDKIVGLEDKANGVDVTFQNGTAWGGIKTQSFDVVVAADGMHSTTRRLMFPELGKMPLYSLGQYMVYFSIPLDPAQDSDMWASWSNAPGGRLAFIRPDMARNRVSAYLGICNNPDGNRLFANYYKLSMEEQKEAWRTLFADTVKENRIAARIFKSMDSPEANDYFMHEIAQVRIPSWTRGHMALLGDAAACPSPISGMGTTVAIVGAYFLALELVKNPNDHVAALRAYEDAMRPVVNKAQKLIPGAPAIMNPQTRWGIWIFYTIIRFISWTKVHAWFEGGAGASRTPVPAWPGENVMIP